MASSNLTAVRYRIYVTLGVLSAVALLSGIMLQLLALDKRQVHLSKYSVYFLGTGFAGFALVVLYYIYTNSRQNARYADVFTIEQNVAPVPYVDILRSLDPNTVYHDDPPPPYSPNCVLVTPLDTETSRNCQSQDCGLCRHVERI